MTKRKSLIATFSLALALSLALVSGIALSGETLTAQAADVASSVTVNGQLLYSGYYLESNESTTYSIGATTEPATYVAWYKDGVLTLNGYNGGEISVGGANAVDLTIKLKRKNTITSSDRGIFASNCENLIIDADNEATLNINVSSSANEVYGIRVVTSGTVTIKGKATLNINAETSVAHAYGISTKTGFNIVGSANLSIKNTSNATSGMSYSIASFGNKPLFNTDGVVTLDNSECAMRNHCIGAYGIDMKKGTLICRYKPGNTVSYACSQTIESAPEGCVLRENPYGLGETVIKSGEGHTVTVENGMEYYERNENQYVEGEEVTIKTSIDGLPFKGWKGEGVTFADATQKETTFVMGNEDVIIKAVYDVFAKQPVFKRDSNDQGSISVQLNKQVSEIREVELVKSTGEVDGNVLFSLKSSFEDYTYIANPVWASQTPKGTYTIRVYYNGYYFYSEPFEIDYTDKTPFAEVSDVVVNGKTGREITPVNFVVTLTYATFKAIPEGTDVSSWFDYNDLPNGLNATISAVSEGAASATITISGTPTAKLSKELYLTIPIDSLATGNDKAVLSKENANAKFDIGDPIESKVTITDGKTLVDGKKSNNYKRRSNRYNYCK